MCDQIIYSSKKNGFKGNSGPPLSLMARWGVAVITLSLLCGHLEAREKERLKQTPQVCWVCTFSPSHQNRSIFPTAVRSDPLQRGVALGGWHVEREKRHRTSKRHNLTFHPCHCAKVVRRVVDSGACVLRVQRSTARFLYTSGALWWDGRG